MAKAKKVAPENSQDTTIKAIKVPKKPAHEPVVFKAVEPFSRFSDFDIGLFMGGKHHKIYEKHTLVVASATTPN